MLNLAVIHRATQINAVALNKMGFSEVKDDSQPEVAMDTFTSSLVVPSPQMMEQTVNVAYMGNHISRRQHNKTSCSEEVDSKKTTEVS